MCERVFDVPRGDLRKGQPEVERFRIPELDAKENQAPIMHRIPLKVRSKGFLAWCKKHACSPSTAASAMVSRAIAREEDLGAKSVVCYVEWSPRRLMDLESTFKNCTIAFWLPVSADDARTMSTAELAARLRTLMMLRNNEEYANIGFAGMSLLLDLGKKLPTRFLKRKVMAVTDSNPQDTVGVDYVGGLTTNGYADRIEDVRYLHNDVFGGSMAIVMSATGDYFYISMIQTFESDRYFEAFCSVLEECGISFERLERSHYCNPVVELPSGRKTKAMRQ